MSSIVEKILHSEFEVGYKPTAMQTKLIDDLVKSYESSDLCEVLFSGAHENYNPHKLASFISMVIWQTPDNGA